MAIANLVFAELNVSDIEVIESQFSHTANLHTFLFNLTTEEKITLPQYSSKDHQFIKTSFEIRIQNEGILPCHLDMIEVRKEMELLLKTNEIIIQLRTFWEKVLKDKFYRKVGKLLHLEGTSDVGYRLNFAPVLLNFIKHYAILNKKKNDVISINNKQVIK